jgi:hypothetical protein
VLFHFKMQRLIWRQRKERLLPVHLKDQQD